MDAKDIRAVSETDSAKSAPAQLLPNGNGARLNSYTLTDNQRAEELRQAELKQVENLVSNVMLARSEMFRQLFDPRRDIDDECGYPRSQVGSGAGAINIELFNTLYEREAIACRVVQVLPKESWQVQPLIYEDEDTENVTEFEEAWDNLGKNLNGGQVSYYKDEADSPIWEHLKRADIQSGIGHFGILLIGIDDGLDLGEPADGVATLEAPILNRSFSTNAERKVALRKFATRSIPTKPNNIIPTYEVVEKKNGGLPIFVGNREMTAEELQRENYLTNNKDSFDMAGLRSDRDKAYNMPSIDSAGVPGSGSSSLGSATSPMGTDAQYVGVQLGPSEYLATKPSTEKRKLIYLRAFNESLVQVVQYEANIHNPRFGQPVMYRVTLNDPREQHSGVGLPMATVRVHWSRLIHLADNLGSSEIFGVPRMRPVLNRLLDLRKLYSGSAEMYWRGAFPGISLETNPQMGGDVIVDTTAIKSMMEQYMNGLQRYLQLTGLSAKTLSPQVVDPTPQINTQIEAIAIQLGIPKRVFCGSERGELASSQDDASWNDRLRERQHNYITPRIIIPFIDRLIAMGVLPIPKVGKNSNDEASNKVAKSLAGKAGGGGAPPDQSALPASPTSSGSDKSAFQAHSRLIYNSNGEAIGMNSSAGYSIEWPDLDSQTAGEKATVALTKTNAMATYVSGQVEAMMPPRDYYVHVLGMSEEEAANILEGAAKAHEEEDVMTAPPMIGGRPVTAPPGTQDHENASMKAEAARQRVDILQQGIDLKGKTVAGGEPSEIQEKEKLTTHGQNSLEAIQKVGKELAQSPLVMPGYQEIFIKDNGSRKLWYVGGDGDERGFEKVMRSALSAIDGVGDISYEAEAFPPKDEGWVQVYPEIKHWTANSFCPTGEGGGIDPSCSRDSGGKHAEEGSHPTGSYLGHPGHIGEDLSHLANSSLLHDVGGALHTTGSVMAAIKLLGGKIGATAQMVEHVVKSYMSDKVGAAVAKLPTSIQKAVNGVWAVMKMGSKAAFASYAASQAFAERVSKERGLTDEQSRRLRGTLSTADVALAKPTALALGVAASFVPMASVGYLAYSTARDPLATLRAARSTVKDAAAGIKSKAGNIKASLKGRFAGNMLTDNEYTILKNALHDHDYDDWYIALVSSAIDEVGDIAGAVEVANKAYEANPTDQSEVEGDEDTE